MAAAPVRHKLIRMERRSTPGRVGVHFKIARGRRKYPSAGCGGPWRERIFAVCPANYTHSGMPQPQNGPGVAARHGGRKRCLAVIKKENDDYCRSVPFMCPAGCTAGNGLHIVTGQRHNMTGYVAGTGRVGAWCHTRQVTPARNGRGI
ncbi:hypothetical protein A6M21_15090 [Desulfotomaculum copahuensis]|uniref:Uncharacterized protein n=1 Tax=Desulfotomaculum copahuensis TaxID=1838280 RepID=A0A1B7LBA3_9FIRM|nr:hypothetical protein A6M21_15090 [Desulfotomaculum copahuensis]